jgi:hypothetical protein
MDGPKELCLHVLKESSVSVDDKLHDIDFTALPQHPSGFAQRLRRINAMIEHLTHHDIVKRIRLKGQSFADTLEQRKVHARKRNRIHAAIEITPDEIADITAAAPDIENPATSDVRELAEYLLQR